MLRLLGIPIAPGDARHLVVTLLADGGPDALSAAAMIAKGVDRELYAVALSSVERDAVLSVPRSVPWAANCPVWLLIARGEMSNRIEDENLHLLRAAVRVLPHPEDVSIHLDAATDRYELQRRKRPLGKQDGYLLTVAAFREEARLVPDAEARHLEYVHNRLKQTGWKRSRSQTRRDIEKASELLEREPEWKASVDAIVRERAIVRQLTPDRTPRGERSLLVNEPDPRKPVQPLLLVAALAAGLGGCPGRRGTW